MLKKIFFSILILLVLLIAAAVALPLIFKDDLIAAVKEQVNETVNAKVDFSDVNISLFRHFPKLSFGLENLKVEGVEAFEGVPLLQTDRLDLALDFWSVIGGSNLKIKGLHLEKPVVNVHILKDGKANYDITKPSPPTKEEEPSDFLIQLESYSIKNGALVYDDRSMDLYAEAKNLNHSGSGNLTADVYDLDTKTSIESLTTTFDGITYLNKVNTKLDAVVNADMKNMKFTLKDNDLLLNALQIITNGWVQLKEEDIDMDLTFNAPSNNFKDLLSLVPGAFTQGYENVKASGTFALNAEVKGTYNGAKEQLPAFKLNAKIENGDVKYPDLPVGISAIFALINVDSPSSDFNQMKLDVSRFSLKIGGNPFEGFFKLKTPVSDPDAGAKMKGTINLGDLAKAFPVAGTEAMNGIVSADMTLKAKMSDVDAGRYEQVQANGFFNISDMLYDAVDMPPVKINELKTTLTPKNLTISSFDGKLGKSDLRASGSIDNVLAYFSTDETMRGDLTLRSDLFDAN
ncbi:MAG TPA: AsmA family protein, partial [Saprospiraceae bacterium]|nr:AsmA family protein [Saprospiraceae bacterium]